PDEGGDGSGQPTLGWQAYLTVYSREVNLDSQGNPRIWLNDPDLSSLGEKLTSVLSQDLSDYIIAYRMYGPASNSDSGGAGGRGARGARTARTTRSDRAAVEGQMRADRSS